MTGTHIFKNLNRVKCRLPREAAKSIQVGHGQVTSKPRRICTDIDHGRISSQLAVKDFSIENVAHGRLLAIHAHVEAEDCLPERRQVDYVALMAEVLLRDLKC